MDVNLTTTKGILVKLITVMYLDKLFHLAKHLGVTLSAPEDVNEKSLRMSQKISFLT